MIDNDTVDSFIYSSKNYLLLKLELVCQIGIFDFPGVSVGDDCEEWWWVLWEHLSGII